MAMGNMGASGGLRRRVYTTPKALETVTAKNRALTTYDQPRHDTTVARRFDQPGRGQIGAARGAQQIGTGALGRERLGGRQPDQRLPGTLVPGEGATGTITGARGYTPGAAPRLPTAPGEISAAHGGPPPRAGAWQGGGQPSTRAGWLRDEGFAPIGQTGWTGWGSGPDPASFRAAIPGAADPGRLPSALAPVTTQGVEFAAQAVLPTYSVADGMRRARSLADQAAFQQSEAGRSSLLPPLSPGEGGEAPAPIYGRELEPLPEGAFGTSVSGLAAEAGTGRVGSALTEEDKTLEDVKQDRVSGDAYRTKIEERYSEDHDEDEIDAMFDGYAEAVRKGDFTWDDLHRLWDEFGLSPSLEGALEWVDEVGGYVPRDVYGYGHEWLGDDASSRSAFVEGNISWEDLLRPKTGLQREIGAKVRLRALLNRRAEGEVTASGDPGDVEAAQEAMFQRLQQTDSLVARDWTTYQEQEWLMSNGMYINQYGNVVRMSGLNLDNDRFVLNLEPEREKGREYSHAELAQALGLEPLPELMPPAAAPAPEIGKYGAEKGSWEEELQGALYDNPLPTHSEDDISSQRRRIRDANAGVYQDALRTAGYQNLMMGGTPEMAMGVQADMMRRVGTASAQQELEREFKMRDDNYRTQMTDAQKKQDMLMFIATTHQGEEVGEQAFARAKAMAEFMDGLKRDYVGWYKDNIEPSELMQILGATGQAAGEAGASYASGYLAEAGKQEAAS